MQDIIWYVISYLQKVVSIYIGYYQVRYFVLTEGSNVYVGYYQVCYLYLQRVVSVYVGYYQVRYLVLTEGSKSIYRILSGTLFRTYRGLLVYMQNIIRYIISYLQRVVSVSVGYYQVCYLIPTEGSKCIYRILSGTLFRTYRGQ